MVKLVTLLFLCLYYIHQTLVLSGLLYLVGMALEMFQKSIKTNIYVLVIVYILFTISILCNIMAVNSANRESKELAEKTFKYKK